MAATLFLSAGLGGSAQAADTSASAKKTGDWATTSTWSNGKAPGATTQIGFNPGTNYTVTIAATTTTAKAGSITIAQGTLDIKGKLTATEYVSSIGSLAGYTGTLQLDAGSSFSSDGLFIGEPAGATGHVTISGTGTTFTTSDSLAVGDSGTGTFSLLAGAKATVTNSADTWIGTSEGATGTATLDGSGTTFSTAGSFIVGFNGTGTLNITNGAKLTSGAGSSYLTGVGGNFGSGTVVIDGAGSSWTSTGDSFVVAYEQGASANITLTNGGVLSTPGTYVNNLGDGSVPSTIKIDGASSAWNLSGQFTLGNYGNAKDTTLTLSNGGSLNAGTNQVFVLNSASLYIGNGQASGSITASGLVNYGLVDFNVTDPSLTFATQIENDGVLTKEGAGVLILSNRDNELNDGIQVNAGTLQGTTSSLNGAITDLGSVIFSQSTNGTVPTISGTGTLTLTGGGSYTLANNSYSGTTTINGGSTASIKADSAFGATPASPTADLVILDNGRITGTGTTNTLSANRGIEIAAGGGTLATSSSTRTLVYNGALDGSGLLTVSPTGTVALGGASPNFTGATHVTSGTLNLTGSLAASAVTVSGTGTLTGTGTVGALTIASGGRVSPGTTTGTLFAGATVFNGGGSLLWQINTAGAAGGVAGFTTGWDLLTVSGALSITATAANPFTLTLASTTLAGAAGAASGLASGQTQTFAFLSADDLSSFDASDFLISPSGITNALTGTWSVARVGNTLDLVYTAGPSAVPEPASWIALAGAGALAAALLRQRRMVRA